MNSQLPVQATREGIDFVPTSRPTFLKEKAAHQRDAASPRKYRQDDDFVCLKPPASAKAERELQRIAAAFGVETFSQCWSDGELRYHGFSNGVSVSWNLDEQRGTLAWVAIGDKENRCLVSREPNLNYGSYDWRDIWEFEPCLQFHALMARGLYCLGFDQPAILAQLEASLSSHQQIEYVLYMPREFRPLKWLEQKGNAESC